MFKNSECPYCGEKMQGDIVCLQCIKSLKLLVNDRVGKTKDCCYFVSPFIYKNIVRDAILNFKFKKKVEFCKSFSYFMALCKLDFFDVMVCVPSFEEKFSSSKEIAKVLRRKVKIKFCCDAIKKIRKTKNQHCCRFDERLTNLKGAFLADPKKVAKKSVLICDDIITTSSTIQEIACACKKAGALKVGAVSFAISETLQK